VNLTTKLREREDPIRVGVVGAGIFGSQLVHAVESTDGMETSVIADRQTEKAHTTFRRAGVDESDVVTAGTAEDVAGAVESNVRAVVDDGATLAESGVDVVVEATGDPNVAARTAYRTLLAGTHFVNASVEADSVCGPLFTELADRTGVTYSLASGDQPGQMIALYEWAGAAGFEVVAVGKATTDHDHYGTPEDAIERYGIPETFGEGIDPDPVMYNSFTDGTKAAVETVATANALGFSVDEGGVNCPAASIEDLPDLFRPESDGGTLSRTPVVEEARPPDDDPTFSVFVVTRTESSQLRDYYAQRRNVVASDDGAYQVFYRPHHFATETTVSIASAVVDGEPTGAPREQATEVVAAAKTDLEPGDEIDGPGGYTIYGDALDADVAADAGYVPFELLDGADVVRSVAQDEYVTEAHVELPDSFLGHLREVQDATLGAE
jgi:predicted homoserine dehydrogenase-like protein